MSPDELQALRKELGFTVQKLADYLGVNKNTVRRWQQGYVPMPRATAMLLLHLRSQHRKDKEKRSKKQ